MMMADWLFVTTVVETVKPAVVAPAGTVTLAGTVAAAVLSLERAAAKPPDGAGAVSLIVPVALCPPRMSRGDTVSDESDAVAAGGGCDETVQPESATVIGVAEPSSTATVQSA